MVDYIAMGRRVKQFREKKGFTQAELAFAVGKSNITISHIECGSGKPELNTVVTIANALGVTVDMLLCDSEEVATAPYLKELEEIAESCSTDELRLLCGIIQPILAAIRKNSQKNFRD